MGGGGGEGGLYRGTHWLGSNNKTATESSLRHIKAHISTGRRVVNRNVWLNNNTKLRVR